MPLEWAAGNLAKKNGRSELGVAFKKPAASHQKESLARKTAAFKPCHVLWMSCIPPPPPPSSPSSFAAFCLRPMARFRWCFLGGKFPSSEGTDSTGGSNKQVDLSRWNRSKKCRQTMEKWKNKTHLIDFSFWKSFWNCHQPFSVMLYFKDWCGMQQCSPHENTHTEQKRAAGDRRRSCIIMTWQAVAIKCSSVFKCVFTNLWCSIHI